MPNPVLISAVIITLNEEQNIERCLDSLAGIADEIVIVDSDSTDKTVELSEKYSAIVYQHAFEGYCRQKQWAAAQAKYDVILSLDADEALSATLRQSISEVKNNWQSDGYTFNRLTRYIDRWIRHCGWYPDQKLRLWDRRRGNWVGVNIHEKVEMNAGATISHLKGDLLHYSYNSIRQHVEQFNKFTDISAREMAERGEHPLLIEALVKSGWKFVRDYIFKLGFLDGHYGFVICRLGSYATFVKYIKTIELNRKK